jgi:hypothetical protein
MTKREALRQTHQENTLLDLGFTRNEAASLRRISMTLHRWHELECGIDHGCVERDEETGKTFWLNSMTGRRSPIADRETGALKRLRYIINARNARRRDVLPVGQRADINAINTINVSAYIQTDPRGAALYIIRPGDVPEGASVESYYNRGICVY